MITKRKSHFKADIICYDENGNIKWQELGIKNIWHDEGEQYLLSAGFATNYSGYGAPPSNLFLGWDSRASLAEADTLASLSGEPTINQNNYARQALSTAGTGVAGQDFVIVNTTPAYTGICKTLTFTASGATWSGKNMFLTTQGSNESGKKLLCSLAFSVTRTLTDGDSANVNMAVAISE